MHIIYQKIRILASERINPLYSQVSNNLTFPPSHHYFWFIAWIPDETWRRSPIIHHWDQVIKLIDNTSLITIYFHASKKILRSQVLEKREKVKEIQRLIKDFKENEEQKDENIKKSTKIRDLTRAKNWRYRIHWPVEIEDWSFMIGDEKKEMKGLRR